MNHSKAIRKKIETMKLYDEIRIHMVQRREPAEHINIISKRYLDMRRRLRYDQIQDHLEE